MKKIYLAGSCSKEQREFMKAVATHIRALGFEVYCPFDLKIPNAWGYTQEEWAYKVYEADIQAIKWADAMVVISTGRDSTAGTNWEQGYAYARDIPVYVFQITTNTTSLMTYWGCTHFRNTDNTSIFPTITELLLDKTAFNRLPCSTKLT